MSHLPRWFSEFKVQATEEPIQFVINALFGCIWLVRFVRGTDLVLGFLNGWKRTGSKKSKNRRPNTGSALGGNQHGAAKQIRVHAIQYFALLRNAAGID